MAGTDTKEEDQLTIVGPGAEADTPETEAPADDESIEETRLGHSESDDEDDSEEEDSLSSRKPYNQMNAEEKRQWRQDKKNRQRKARQRDQTELNFLRSRNENLERRLSQIESRTASTEAMNIDQRISQIKSQISVADQVIAKAVESGAGSEMVEAQRIRESLNANLDTLENLKANTRRTVETSSQSETPRRPAQPQIPPKVIQFANEFTQRHPWFQKGANEDSDIVTVIDSRVLAEGFDPTTQEYWDELEDRIQKRLPHRFKSSKNGKSSEDESLEEGKPVTRKSGGPAFSSNGRAHRPLKRGEVFVSEERKQAMIQAGVWDDPILRNKYLKSYARYDQENGTRNRA